MSFRSMLPTLRKPQRQHTAETLPRPLSCAYAHYTVGAPRLRVGAILGLMVRGLGVGYGYVIGAACLVVCSVLAARFFFWPAEPVDMTGQQDVRVILGASGFEPEFVYVSRGSTVTFSTTLDRQFWPASDLHPFHAIYRAFDPLRPLEPHESWSFTFAKDGHWNFHDHMNPLLTGAIIVVPPGEKGSKEFDVLAQCDQEDIEGRRSCWKYRISAALQEGGLARAFEEVRDVYGESSGFPPDCHLYVHDLGLLAYQKYGTRVPLSGDMTTCGQGFFHGYMEGVLASNNGDVETAEDFCSRVEKKFRSSTPFLGPQCFHGIGHGQMEYLLTVRPDLMSDLPTLVQLGVEDCSVLPNDDARFRCSSGVYAVLKDWINIQDLSAVHHEFFSLSDPFALCRRETDDWARRACAWEFAKQALILADRNPHVAFPAILQSGQSWSPDHVYLMVRSAAFLVGERGVEWSDADLAGMCRTIMDSELHAACIEGIENGILFSGHPGNEVERSARFCSYQGLSKRDREGCESLLLTYMKGAYGDSGFKSACDALVHLDPLSRGCHLAGTTQLLELGFSAPYYELQHRN